MNTHSCTSMGKFFPSAGPHPKFNWSVGISHLLEQVCPRPSMERRYIQDWPWCASMGPVESSELWAKDPSSCSAQRSRVVFAVDRCPEWCLKWTDIQSGVYSRQRSRVAFAVDRCPEWRLQWTMVQSVFAVDGCPKWHLQQTDFRNWGTELSW